MKKTSDISQALEELGISPKDYLNLVGKLEGYLEETMPKLCSACKEMDFEAIKQLSHSIKGSLLNLRFFQAAEIATKLEETGTRANAGRLSSLLKELQGSLGECFRHVRSNISI